MLVDHRVMRRRDTIARIWSHIYLQVPGWFVREICLCSNGWEREEMVTEDCHS